MNDDEIKQIKMEVAQMHINDAFRHLFDQYPTISKNELMLIFSKSIKFINNKIKELNLIKILIIETNNGILKSNKYIINKEKLKFNHNSIIIYDQGNVEEQIIKLYKSGIGLLKLSKMFKINWRKIKDILIKNNVKISHKGYVGKLKITDARSRSTTGYILAKNGIRYNRNSI